MYDVLIKQATIIDGTGIPGWKGDVAIKDGIFALIEPSLSQVIAKEYIPGDGLVLAPGFIDIHCHSDDFWLEDSLSEIKLQQGVTREIFGNCGVSMAPMGSVAMLTDFQRALCKIEKHYNTSGQFSFLNYRALLEEKGLYNNVMGLVGHGTIRFAAMGFSDKKPDQSQMGKMKNLLGEAMDQGAIGMSTGLIYAPGIFAQLPELIELCRVVASKGGFYASHIRNEAEEVLAAIDEAITIGKHAEIPIQISHLKITGNKNWGLVDQVIEKLESARKNGVDLTCDVYPYFSSRTSLTALIPPWAIEGGVEHLLPRLRDSVRRKKIIHDIRYGIPGWENMYHNAGWEKITISVFSSAEGKDIEGRTVAEIARERKIDPFELVLNLIEQEGEGVKIIAETMNEENVAAFLKLPFSMVGSDSSFSEGSPHPRLYGTFPRVIRRFVREKKILKLEEAIHKMTGLPAHRIKLKNVGLIKKGFQADAVLFDPATISDKATYKDPCRFPSGIIKVIVNGQVVISNNVHTEVRAGKFDLLESMTD